jgi:membrane protease YdiL (CAAX protease family)
MEIPYKKVQAEKRKFQLHEHPWLSLLAVVITIVVAIILASNLVIAIGLSPYVTAGQVTNDIAFQLLTVFIFVPFVLRLPKGKRTYRQYLDDIGLTRVQPFIQLVLLGLSCYVILALSQAAASLVYRFFEGLPVTWSFIRRVFDLSGDMPPGSPSLLVSFPSIFEEAVFRGIVLTVFLNRYSERKAIIFSALGFGLMHLLNLASGRELVWVMGQVVWAFILGLFYGYVFSRTRSLLPPMIVHYLGNVFIGSLTGYMQNRASIEMQALYGIIFSLGIVPTTLMILWTRFFVSRWLPSGQSPVSSETNVKLHQR